MTARRLSWHHQLSWGANRRRTRQATVVVSVLAVLASYGVAGSAPASAGSVSGSSFEIDDNANLVVDGGGGAIDWLAGGSGTAMRANVMVRPDAPSGSTDDSFTQGTHEDSTTPTLAYANVPPNKNDLTNFGVYVEKYSSANFVNVFFTRAPSSDAKNPVGDANIDFEFNQSSARSNDPSTFPQVVPVRTAGDILITYDFTVGGSQPTLSRRTWDGTQWGPETMLDASQAIGSINSSTIAAADAGGLGELLPLTFGEASIDMAALVPDQSTCLTYGSVYVKSRSSGSSFNSSLQDFVAPEPVTISNCGSVQIHKTDDNGALAGAGFTLYKDVAPTGGTSAGAEDKVPANVIGTCTTNASGDCTITDVPKGNAWLVETTVPAAHDPAPDQYVTITAGDQVVPLTLNDPVQYGTITVTKVAVPQDAQDFTFSLDGSPFSLDDDPTDATLPNTRSFQVVVGTHSLSETNIPSGWVNTNLVCNDPTSDTTVAKPDATVKVSKGETVACTYTDTFTKLDVNLQTQAAVAQANTSWNDSASLTGDGVHPVTGTVTFFACDPHATATACTSGGTQVGTAATVTHVSGASYAATTTTPFTPSGAGWTCFRAEYTSSSAYYVDSTHTNTSTECFLKQNANLTVSKTAVAAYGRAYHWTIGKAVDKTRVDIAAGGSATFNYTVTVGNSHTDNAWTVTGKISVTNPNPVPFTGVNVTDAIDNGAGACAVSGGSSVTVPASSTVQLDYTCTYTTAPSPSTGTNTATATWDGTANFTPASSATGTATVDFSTVTPSTTDEIVTVTDSVKGTLGTVDARTAANPTTFTYSVTRAGVAGTCTAYDNTATFTTNDTQTTGSDSKSVTVCVGSNLTVSKSATGTLHRDDLWTISKDVDKTKVSIAAGGTATFTYTVTATPNGVADSAYSLSGTIHVANPNDWEDVVATVTDVPSVGGGASCTVTGGTNVTIPKSGSVDLPYSCTFTGAPTEGRNTATAAWDSATYHTPAGTASGSASVSFAVGQETHTTVTVVDDKTDPAHPVTLGTADHSEGPTSFTYSITKQGVAGTCTDYTNTAVLVETGQSASKTVTVCVGSNLTVSKTALASDHATYLWSIAKGVDQTHVNVAPDGTAHFTYTVTATPAGQTADGWSVSGDITVTNPNDWESVTANVTDSLDTGGAADCALSQGPSVVVPASSTVTIHYTCSFASQPSNGTNTATATWDKAAAATPDGSATGTASVVFVPATQTDHSITVVDDKTDPAHPVVLGTAVWGDTPTSFTYSLDKPGVAGTCTDYTNTASIQETEQSAARTVTVCSGSGVITTASAAGSFDRTFAWTIAKSVDSTRITNPNGSTGTFTYTVTVTPAGIVDSGYVLGGSVTVSNPNDWEDITTTVTVTSDVGGGADCTVEGGTGATIPAAGSLTLPYSCTFTGAPAVTGNVTATSTWDGTAAATDSGSSDATTPVTFGVGSETNHVITVVDDKTDPANPVTLGTWNYDDGAHDFVYSLTKAGVDSVCTDYTNLAQIVETQQSATVTATLCHTFTGGGGGPVVNPPTGGGGLPFTGAELGLLARTAAALLAAGLVLLAISRRRRSA